MLSAEPVGRSAGHTGEAEREIDGGDSRKGSPPLSNPRLVCASSAARAVWAAYVLLHPCLLARARVQCPRHLTQGKGLHMLGRWVTTGGQGGLEEEIGWVGSRWLSPKASAGVAGGECVRVCWGMEVRVCVCLCV